MMISQLGMNYRKVTEKIREKLKPLEAYTFLGLLFKSDYTSYRSSVNEQTIADYLHIPRDRVIDHITKLESAGLVKISQTNNGYRKKNHYLCNTAHYFLATDQLLALDLPAEDIGFLLILKACCINYTNLCTWSVNELTDNVAISKPTVIKYLKRLESAEIITRKDGKIRIVKEGLFIDTTPTDIAVMRNYYPEALDEQDFDSNGNFIK